ncbi:hypothetical protein AB833_22365 [Chromatiales bacterium (ex Bugula neritina AB1)]|nr:hypothetical protein AB833_22365 [Chromatiales bacterium (ex Bugula neritina AB1)]
MTQIRPQPFIRPLNIRKREARVQPEGLPVIDLSFNELPFAPNPSVLEAINRTTAHANFYGNPSCEAVRTALAQHYALDPEQLVVGNGSEELLDVIGRVFANSESEILISEYGYIQFPIVANRVGATLVKAPESHYTTVVDALLLCVTGRTDLLFLANPNNPTGTMIPASEITRLAEHLPQRIALVIDLAYAEFAGGDYCEKMHQLVNSHDNIIVTRTFSKAFGLAGLRIGWLHAPAWMIPTLYAARGMGTANAAAQAAAIAALDNRDSTNDNVTQIVDERNRIADALQRLGITVVASQANFMMVASPENSEESATEMAAHLFDDAGLLVNQTRETGLEHFIRFSVSLPEHNNRLIQSLADFIQSR